jgi:hypothetical protein
MVKGGGMARMATTFEVRQVARLGAVHWTAVAGYAFMCAAGSYNMWEGLVLLGFFAIIAAIRAIFSNPLMLFIVLAIAGISAVFPPAAILLPIIAVFLFCKRLAFLASHIKIVAAGLVVYAIAIAVAICGKNPDINAVTAGYGVMGAVIMHLTLCATRRLGYSAAQAVEIMSVVPLLLAAMILPFLKFDIGLDHAGFDVHAPIDSVAIDHGAASSLDSPAFSTAAAHGPNAFAVDHCAPILEHSSLGHSAGLVASSKASLDTASDLPHLTPSKLTHVTDALGRLQEVHETYGDTTFVRGNGGIPIGHVEHGVDADVVRDNVGQTVLIREHGPSSDTVYDHLHQPVAHVEHSGGTEVVRDNTGKMVCRVEKQIDGATIVTDPLGRTISRTT